MRQVRLGKKKVRWEERCEREERSGGYMRGREYERE